MGRGIHVVNGMPGAPGAGAPRDMADNAVRLLWTAGWDSTFRLLMLLLVHRKPVRPIYLIDTERASTLMELRRMHEIRAILAERHPDTRELLLPTFFEEVGDIRPDQAITAKFQRLLARSHLGVQYDWLARLAVERGLDDLELSIHRDDRAAGFLAGHVVRVENDGDAYYRLSDTVPEDDLSLFRAFRFPIFDLTKLQMQREAEEHGFGAILERTWFCHRPTRTGKPCGVCGPCRYTAEEGLKRRIPLTGRLRALVRAPLRPVARWARRKLKLVH